METFLSALWLSAAVIGSYMLILFVVAQLLRNNSIVDIAWGAGFALVAAVSWWLRGRQLLAGNQLWITLATCIWGLRLAVYLYIRNAGKPEDFRYVNFRKQWGAHPYIGAFFHVFLLQGVIMWVNTLPQIVGNSFAAVESAFPWLGVGMCLWGFGFLFEAIGDAQLMQFKKNPVNKGKVMRFGLWSLTRHPNYFGELVLQWGIWLMTVPHGYWYITIVAPLSISFLLLKVSGVPMLEKKYVENQEYQKYVKEVASFFPFVK